MDKIELLNTLKHKQYEYAKKTTARVGLDIYGSVIELVKTLDVTEKSSSILKATELLVEKETERAAAFDALTKEEPTESFEDWRNGYLYGMKEGMLRQARESVETIQSIN